MRKVATITAMVVLAAACCSAAQATSWSSFKSATFSGIYVQPRLESGLTEYTVTLDPAATVTFDGAEYQVVWIGGFYVNSVFSSESFNATDATWYNDWTWDQYPMLGPDRTVAGWKCSGNSNRMYASIGASKKFRFGNLQLGSAAVYPGFHIEYLDGCNVETDFFAGPTPNQATAPEPSGLQAGIGLLAFGAALAGRRMRRPARK